MFTTPAGGTRPSFIPEPGPLRLSPSPPSLPTGECRFILLHPSVPNQRCSCQGFHHNRNVAGSSCECGHQACYHVHTPLTPSSQPDSNPLPPASHAAILDKVRKLEDALQNERNARKQDLRAQQEELKEERRVREREIRIIREAVAPFYRSEEEIKRSIVELEDRLEGNYDEQIRLQGRIIALDDITESLDKRLDDVANGRARRDSEGARLLQRPNLDTPILGSSPTNKTHGTATQHLTKNTDKRNRNQDSPSPSMQRENRPRNPMSPVLLRKAASAITNESDLISNPGSPGLPGALAPVSIDENHPRSSGILDLSFLPSAVESPTESHCSSHPNPLADLNPTSNSVATFVQTAFPKFTSALAPYEIPPTIGKARSCSYEVAGEGKNPRSADLFTALVRSRYREGRRSFSRSEDGYPTTKKRKRTLSLERETEVEC